MSKRSKLLFFHSWLNLTMKDLFLGLLNLFVSVIACNEFTTPRENGGGERAQISRRPGFSYTTAKEMAMCK